MINKWSICVLVSRTPFSGGKPVRALQNVGYLLKLRLTGITSLLPYKVDEIVLLSSYSTKV